MVAQALLARFSGRGIVPNDIAGSGTFLLAVAIGAGLTVILATVTGFPISTTHALTGGIVGAGLIAVGSVNMGALGRDFFMPLAFSPLLAVGVAAAIYGLLRIAGLTAGTRHTALVDGAHFVSAGIVSFARGLNDTPKIAAMLLGIRALEIHWGMVAIAVAMALGGLLSARRVAETMSHRITGMNPGEGLGANLSTGVLVVLASKAGLPVSTTHVSVGSLFGIGLLTGKANVRVVLGIILSWVLTLPCGAILSAATYWIAERLGNS